MWDTGDKCGTDVPHQQTIAALGIEGCFQVGVGLWDKKYTLI